MTCANNQNETDACKAAHKAFDDAHLAYLHLKSKIKTITIALAAAGATVAIGAGVAAIPFLGWLPGLIIAAFGVGMGISTGAGLLIFKRRCARQINKMYAAYITTHTVCETVACKLKKPEYEC